jgi:hypothetical protein
MSELRGKVTNALNEARILVLVAQVLLGIQYESAFQEGFATLPWSSRFLRLISLSLLLLAFILLLTPATYHRIVEVGADTARLHRFTGRVVGSALVPFAVSMTMDLYVGARTVVGPFVSLMLSLGAGTAAGVFWFGWEGWLRRKSVASRRRHEEAPGSPEPPLKDRVEQLLMETRMVLPGVQMLLGFQFLILLMPRFQQADPLVRLVHLICLFLSAGSLILLMTPAAYHRLVEEGRDTERFCKVTSALILGAMAFLAGSLSGDFFVVLLVATGSTMVAAASGVGMAVLAFGLWFGWMYWERGRIRGRRPS